MRPGDRDRKEMPNGYHYAARPDEVLLTLSQAVDDDGRSEWRWVRGDNGDLMLAVFPKGETYFALEEMGAFV